VLEVPVGQPGGLSVPQPSRHTKKRHFNPISPIGHRPRT
jgi:hypothetical protein